MRGKKIVEGLRELINNHMEVVVALIFIYVLGFVHRIVRNIIKEKNNRKK